MSGPIRVLEFETVEAMRAHYKALRARTIQVQRDKALAVVPRKASTRPDAFDPPPMPENPTWDDLRAQADALIQRGLVRARVLAQEEADAEAAAEGYAPVKAILARHAEAAGLTVNDLLGPTRMAPVVRARHAAMFELWDEGRRMNLSQVGRIFGRDHTTVLNAVRQARKRLALAGPCDAA